MAKFPVQPDDGGVYPSANSGTEEQKVSRADPIDVQLDTMRRASLECLLAGNYADARVFATGALLVLAAIPDGIIGGISSQIWNKSAINQFLIQIEKLEANADVDGSGGIVMMPVEYTGRRGGGC